MIVELEKSAAIRASRSCRVEIAKAVGRYVSAHKNRFGPLRDIALDRALVTACTGPLRDRATNNNPLTKIILTFTL